ncbi:hypothetical protein LOY67_14930 [Pseudomonas sp. B21-056]|jgi:hypothetical protein|uniref:hypothetical protein n=1 Tax=Pseudomonas sp. B21-056 TaxID=2895495 RepID=UPI002230FE60|nr:hypothetical protein [Pseudomonas sp. B21-056]UZE21342.1 hypothetical protein LOY67_14930 [Pseudomonas sp. B21-056]
MVGLIVAASAGLLQLPVRYWPKLLFPKLSHIMGWINVYESAWQQQMGNFYTGDHTIFSVV